MEEVVFEVGGGLYPLPERQATILAEKLRLFAKGKFPDDVRRLAAGAGWIEGARPAADLIEDTLVERRLGLVAQLLYVRRLGFHGRNTVCDDKGRCNLTGWR